MARFAWMPPSVTEFVTAWLAIEFGANNVGAERPTADRLPYRMVNRVAGVDDKVTESSTVSVHTFASTMEAAETQAQLTHRVMLQLGPPIVGQTPVTISNSQIVVADFVETKQSPVWVYYADTQIFRFVARYEIDLRFQPVSP